MNAQRFLEILAQIGYPNVDKLPFCAFDYFLEDEELAPIFQIFNEIDENNILTSEEVKRFEALKEAGAKLLDLDENEAAKIDSEEEEMPIEELREEVLLLSEELAALEQQKEMEDVYNEKLRKDMSENIPIENTKVELKDIEKEHQNAMMSCQIANNKMNKVLGEAQKPLSTIEDIVRMAYTLTQDSQFLAFMPLEEFQTPYKAYNCLLKEYIHKQFHADIMNMAELGSEVNYKLIDLNVHPREKMTDEQLKMYKLLKMHHTSFCKVENQLAMAYATENGIKKQIKEGEDLLGFLMKGAFPYMDIISSKLADNKVNEARNQAIIDDLKANVIPKLVTSLADANASIIITGNYDLKWKRQQYVTSKMDQLILWLAEHQSQAEFYNMCLTSEYGICRQIHQFLQFVDSASAAQLDGYRSRTAAMEELRRAALKFEETDKENTLLKEIEKILQNHSSTQGEKRVLSSAQRLLTNLKCLKDSWESGKLEVKMKNSEMTRRLGQINFCLMSLRDAEWADCPTKAGPPQLDSKQIGDLIEKLETKFKKLEYEFLANILQLQEKKKILKSSAQLQKHRNSYLEFYSKLL